MIWTVNVCVNFVKGSLSLGVGCDQDEYWPVGRKICPCSRLPKQADGEEHVVTNSSSELARKTEELQEVLKELRYQQVVHKNTR